MRALGVELAQEGIEAFLLLQAVGAWRPSRLLFEGEMHAFVPTVLLRMAWLDALDGNAKPEPPDRKLRQIEQGIGTGKGDAVIRANGTRQPAFMEQALEDGNGRVFAGRIQRLAKQQEARGMIADRQGKAVAAIAEFELALEVGAPEIIGGHRLRQRRAARAMARPGAAFDQTVAVEHRVDRALGR